MPTCTSCGRWDPPTAGMTACSTCGGPLGHSEAWQRAAAAAAAEGLTVDELRYRRDMAARARGAELAAAQEAAAASLRQAARGRLIGEGLREAFADEWLSAWERHARQDRSVPVEPWTAAYWDTAQAWIDESRAVRPRPAQWDHHPLGPEAGSHGQGLGLAWLLFAIPATVVLGVILLLAFLLLGEPPWIPVVGTLVGLVGGTLLMIGLDSGTWPVVDWLAYRIAWVDRHGDAIWDALGLYLGLAMLPITTIAASVLLMAVT